MTITTISDTERELRCANSDLVAECKQLRDEIENLKAYAKHERSLGAEPWSMKCLELEQDLKETSNALADAHQEIEMLRRADIDRQAAMVRLQGIEYNADRDEALLLECYNELYIWDQTSDVLKEQLRERLGL
jgi:putative heme degradation protein